MSTRLVNVSNPAAFGVEWEQDGTRYQMANPRGTLALWFAIRPEGRPWSATIPVTEPGRFMATRPKTFKDFERAVQAFIAAGQDSEESLPS